MHRGQRKQARDWSVVLVEPAVGKNQQRVPGLDGLRGTAAELVERALQARLRHPRPEERGQRGGQEIALRNAAQLFQIAIGQDRMRQFQRVAMLRRLLQNVALAFRCS